MSDTESELVGQTDVEELQQPLQGNEGKIHYQ